MENLEVEDFINLGVVFNEKGEILLIRRVREEIGGDGSKLTWAFPGGKQRLTESRTDCVKREILAETGYDIESFKEISLRPHPQFSVFIVYHRCRLISPKPIAKPSEPHEVAEIRWVKPQEIKSLIATNLDPKVAKELGLK
jgi:8-oxo-dGTP pyrophosphatase MutT (NUDIX family)